MLWSVMPHCIVTQRMLDFLILLQGNKIENTKKKAKLSSAELRKKKKERMARYVAILHKLYGLLLTYLTDERGARRSFLMRTTRSCLRRIRQERGFCF